jgi:hypothetical protein
MGKKRPPGWLEALLASGELARTAQGCATEQALAVKLGVTYNSYYQIAHKMRQRGGYWPTLAELQNAQEVKPAWGGVLTSDFGDETPTNPELHIDTAIAARREKSESATLRRQLGMALAEIEKLRLQAQVATDAEHARGSVPRIERHHAGGALREATAVAIASDWHIEEHVDAASVNGVNEYNLEIARKRAAKFFSGFIYLIRYHQDHFSIKHALLGLLGDLITGYLREENLEANELSPVQAIASLDVWIYDGIRQILDETDVDLDVVCLSGNHGRLTDKVRPSTREANSIEWLLYVGLARRFANESRVRFHLPAGSQTYFKIYDYTIRFLHGDECKFGGGIGGVTIPIYKAMARYETVRHADLTVLGHFHQYHDLSDLVVNGSLIGYTPYSQAIGARFEQPRQAFFLVDSVRGKTMPADIWVT